MDHLYTLPVVRPEHLPAHQPGHHVLGGDPPRREAWRHALLPLIIALLTHDLSDAHKTLLPLFILF